MTIKQSVGKFVVHCDECPEDIETEESDFDAARAMAAEAGWRTFRGPDGKWANSCPACVETFKHRKK
jgi:hypothetical protein